MSSIKKNQHYVWKHFLKPWTSNNKICCLRNGKTFNTSLDNIANRRYFYESTPLNEDEFKIILSFIDHLHPTAKASILNLFKIYYISANSSDNYLNKCGIEDLHGIVESNFIPVLDKLHELDMSFLNNEEEKNTFSFFIGCQYSRTNRIRNNYMTSKMPIPDNVNRENLAKVLSLLFADIIGNWVYSNSKFCLIRNESKLNFITGDQPIINLKDTGNPDVAPTEFELFYPITPTIAILLKRENSEQITIKDDTEIIKYNKLIRNNSIEQLFALKQEDFNIDNLS